MKRKSTPSNLKIPVREDTRQKFDTAARTSRRTLCDVADLAVELYLKTFTDLKQPESPQATRTAP